MSPAAGCTEGRGSGCWGVPLTEGGGAEGLPLAVRWVLSAAFPFLGGLVEAEVDVDLRLGEPGCTFFQSRWKFSFTKRKRSVRLYNREDE